MQVYYARKTRHIGYFDTEKGAISASKAARDCLSSFKESDMSPEQVKRNVEVMKKAASRFKPLRKKRLDNIVELPTGVTFGGSNKWVSAH